MTLTAMEKLFTSMVRSIGLFGCVVWIVSGAVADADEADKIAQLIDARIAARWTALKIESAPTATDAEFHRRVWLDLAGRIPTAGQTRQFLENPRTDKRRQLIDQVLGSGAFVGHFSRTLRTVWLPTQDTERFPTYAAQFEDFLRDRLQRDTPYDQIVKQILVSPTDATGSIDAPRDGMSWRTSLGFFEANERRPEVIAASAARNFLGVQIECAQCHDHPFGDWKREQFWQLAAFFSDKRHDREPTIQIPELEKTVAARFLNGTQPQWGDDTQQTAREVLAGWITSRDNPYFAKAAVNRVWSHCFGIGLIEPVDDLNAATDDLNTTTSSTHTQLLDELAQAFAEQHFDLKVLLRGMMRSKAYSLTSRRTHPSQDDPAAFARMSVKALTAQQLYDSTLRAAGYSTNGASSQQERVLRDEFLKQFGSSERRVEAVTSIPQMLTRMNGPLAASVSESSSSPFLIAVCEAPYLDHRGRIDELFLATLSRPPTVEESRKFTAHVAQGMTSHDHSNAFTDLFWILLNTHEFSVNH